MGTPTVPSSLLLIEDDPSLLAILRRFLESRGFLLECASTGAAALDRLKNFRPTLVVLDLGLPDMRGEDVLFHVLDRDPACRVLVSSGTPFSLEQVPPAQRTRVAILQKPYLPKTLLQCLEKMLGDGSVQ